MKNKWKSLAEDEKARHQQQYPTYRYQPKRHHARRNSLSPEGGRCPKCAGRTILPPPTPHDPTGPSVPQTPHAIITPVTKTLPVLSNLTLQSPIARRMGGKTPLHHMMSPGCGHPEDRDDLGPMSPGPKRRRFNADHPPVSASRTLPPRYTTVPASPYPFAPQPSPAAHHHHRPSYPALASSPLRRDSLPGLRVVATSPTGPMPPPPPRTAGIGYQQHRLSQGHGAGAHDRSLTLPPLHTTAQHAPPLSAAPPLTARSSPVSEPPAIHFRYKIKVLCQVAPPAPRRTAAPRGPLIAVEADSPAAALRLAAWLRTTLAKEDALAVRAIDGPALEPAAPSKTDAMAQYHRLAAHWLGRTPGILASIAVPSADPPEPPTALRATHDGDDYSSDGDGATPTASTAAAPDAGAMDVDADPPAPAATPVAIIANYSLHASNVFAHRIPIGPHDPYSPNDHWQWTATQWRGIVGPDLTVYVRDAAYAHEGGGARGATAAAPAVEIETVEGRPDVGLFVVRRTETEAEMETRAGAGGAAAGAAHADTDTDAGADADVLEPSVLRRLGFEIGEWVRAFETNTHAA